MRGFARVALGALGCVIGISGRAAAAADPAGPLPAMRAELDRQFAKLSTMPERPVYYLAYRVTDSRAFRVWAAWGGETERRHEDSRFLDMDLRVGSPALDNTHRGADDAPGAQRVPLDNDPDALRTQLWLATDRRYRDAAERFARVVADHAVKVKEEDDSPDFCAAPKADYARVEPPPAADEEAVAAEAARLSRAFRAYPDVLESVVQMSAQGSAEYMVNSEGSALAQYQPICEVRIYATSRADDGMDFSLFKSYSGHTFADLPSEAALTADAKGMGDLLARMKAAPLVDPFVGPAMLSGRAAAVLFHEVLGHRLEGHRQKDEDADQTFTKKIGKSILPPFLSVISDPTLEKLGDTQLNGYYRYDDEGVAGERVTLVDHGILRGFMMCRSPVKGFPVSNGHGRGQPGRAAVARQSNLLVVANKTMPVAGLRRELIKLCKARHRPYGLFFEDIEGGFTFTSRTIPNAFNVMPVCVWRIYADGRPDELVRGVDLIGTPLTTLERIVAAGDDRGIFNGWCGAESGYVPVSAVCPSLLVSEMEVQRKEKGQQRQPLLPAPAWEPHAP